mmetsp:Transcript_7606/g.20274  ORF Transcript_7606/g.20274 Transcript_7606/m.20274 type:complete len:165 (-) Transcript_7606:344-838(-)
MQQTSDSNLTDHRHRGVMERGGLSRNKHKQATHRPLAGQQEQPATQPQPSQQQPQTAAAPPSSNPPPPAPLQRVRAEAPSRQANSWQEQLSNHASKSNASLPSQSTRTPRSEDSSEEEDYGKRARKEYAPREKCACGLKTINKRCGLCRDCCKARPGYCSYHKA